MAEEGRWFSGRLRTAPPPPPGVGASNNGGLVNPNTSFPGSSLPVSGFENYGSGFSTPIYRQTNNSSAVSGVASQAVSSKRMKIPDSNDNSADHQLFLQEGLGSMAENFPPIGLKLRKSPSLLNFIETRLAEKRKASAQLSQISDCSNQYETQPNINHFVSPQSSEKFKATNFHAKLIRIGNWVWESKYDGHLVAKCYFCKRKLVWEILEDTLKKKIEFQWSEISAMRTNCNDDPTVLEIELSSPPMFYGEKPSSPKKHTTWDKESDFTGGQALIHRRHLLKFSPGVLGKHYQKLLQYDSRLCSLSQKPFPFFSYPYFEPGSSNGLDFSIGKKPDTLPRILQPLQTVKQTSAQAPSGTWDSTSPMSVMDFASHETANENGTKRRRGPVWGHGMPYVVPAIQANQEFTRSLDNPKGKEFRGLVQRDQQLILRVEEQLLDDKQAFCSDEESLLAKVRSMGSLIQPLQQDGNNGMQTGFSNSISRGKEMQVMMPAVESDYGGGTLGEQKLVGKGNGTELGLTSEELFLLSEMQKLENVPFDLETEELGFGQDIVPDPFPAPQYDLLGNPNFVAQGLNMEFGQEVPTENQQPRFQTPHWVPQPQFPNRSLLSQENQQIFNAFAAVPQVAAENQMANFQGNNSIASQFLNENGLMQHERNSSGLAYPQNFPGARGRNFW